MQSDYVITTKTGLLGAVIPSGFVGAPNAATNARLMMIEYRILRIEEALRRAGIEVESIPLGEVYNANEG